MCVFPDDMLNWEKKLYQETKVFNSDVCIFPVELLKAQDQNCPSGHSHLKILKFDFRAKLSVCVFPVDMLNWENQKKKNVQETNIFIIVCVQIIC